MTKWTRLITIAAVSLLLDACSKALVKDRLQLHEQREFIGEYLRITYIHNPGAAFGISIGAHSRVIFAMLAIIALIGVGVMYSATPREEITKLNALALISGGALGNLWNRFITKQGVVDWIDVGLGSLRWPVFNIADVAVTTGAVVLALSLWREQPEGVGKRV